MANRINQDAKATRPLWIIAVSLLTIAVCLVLLVVKQHFFGTHEDVALTTVAVEESDKTPTNAVRKRSTPVRPTPSLQTATELNETIAVAESAKASQNQQGSVPWETARSQLTIHGVRPFETGVG